MSDLGYDEMEHFDVIEIIDGGGGYDWTEGRLIKAKATGELFFIVESGCSCNDWMSNVGQHTRPQDLQHYKVANWQEAVEVAKKEAMDRYYSGWDSATVYAFADRLNKKERI